LRNERSTYNGKGALQEFHLAYILPQATSHLLHNNNQASLPIFGYEAGQLLLLPPAIVKHNCFDQLKVKRKRERKVSRTAGCTVSFIAIMKLKYLDITM